MPGPLVTSANFMLSYLRCRAEVFVPSLAIENRGFLSRRAAGQVPRLVFFFFFFFVWGIIRRHLPPYFFENPLWMFLIKRPYLK